MKLKFQDVRLVKTSVCSIEVVRKASRRVKAFARSIKVINLSETSA